METTVARLRQIVLGIVYSNYLEDRKQRQLFGWLGSQITQWIAVSIPFDSKSGSKSPVEMAQETVLIDAEARELKEFFDKNPPTPKPKENAPGSFEAFMASFGGHMEAPRG